MPWRDKSQSSIALSTVIVVGCTYVPLATSPRISSSALRASYFIGVTLSELLAFPVDDAYVDGQLAPNDRSPASATGQLDAFDLRW